MTALGVALLLLWCTVAGLLFYGALRVAARADTVEAGFDRDDGWCPDCNLPMAICRHDEDSSGDNALLSVGPLASSGTDEDGGEG